MYCNIHNKMQTINVNQREVALYGGKRRSGFEVSWAVPVCSSGKVGSREGKALGNAH
jgi:hypothetical protein